MPDAAEICLAFILHFGDTLPVVAKYMWTSKASLPLPWSICAPREVAFWLRACMLQFLAKISIPKIAGTPGKFVYIGIIARSGLMVLALDEVDYLIAFVYINRVHGLVPRPPDNALEGLISIANM